MSKEISRRQFLKAAGVSALGGLLAACSPQVVTVTQVVNQTQQVTQLVNQTQEVTKVVEITSTPATGPKNSRGLVLPADALPLDKQVWNNPLGTVGGAYGHIMESLYNRAFEHNGGYESLTTLNNDFETVGVGADSWTQSTDGTYWDFKLHPGLMWSDGTPVKASDWVFTLQRSLANNYDFAWFYFDIKNAQDVTAGKVDPSQLGISAVDDLTLRITTSAPTAYVPSLGTWFCVAPPQAYNNSMGPTNNWALDPSKYISCGPFILTQFNRGVEDDWGSNTKYTGVRKVYFEKIIEKPWPTGLAAYISGAIQNYTLGSSPAEQALVQANPVLRSESHPQPPQSTDYIGWNLIQPTLKDTKGNTVKNPFLDNDVCVALCKSIDKNNLVGQVFNGYAIVANGLLPKGFPNFNPDLANEDVNKFDAAAAQALLTKAGFPKGQGFPVFDFWLRQFAAGSTILAMAQAIQAQWKTNLGIDVSIKNADFQGFTTAAFTDKTAALYYVGYGLDFYDPADFMNVFVASSLGGRHPVDNVDWTTQFKKDNALMDPTARFKALQQDEKAMVDSADWFFVDQTVGVILDPCNLVGPATEPNKDGYRFYGGGGPGVIHAYEEMYWSNSDCRKGINS